MSAVQGSGRCVSWSALTPAAAAASGDRSLSTVTPPWLCGHAATWWPNTARHAAPQAQPSAATIGERLHGYLTSAQLWKPATLASHRHVVSTLAGDPLCRCRLQSLTPAVVRAAICRWCDEGVSVPKVSAHWLLLRSAVSWAVAEGLLRLNPLAGMPARPWPGAITP